MAFDWNNYYLLANALKDNTPPDLNTINQEAIKRTAISRAYYSLLIQARTKLCQLLSETAPRGSTHKWVIDNYNRLPERDARRLSSKIRRLKKVREKADYDDYINNLDREVESMFLDTQDAFNILSRL